MICTLVGKKRSCSNFDPTIVFVCKLSDCFSVGQGKPGKNIYFILTLFSSFFYLWLLAFKEEKQLLLHLKSM